MKKILALLTICSVLQFIGCTNKQPEQPKQPTATKNRLQEGFPTSVISRLSNRNERIASGVKPSSIGHLQAVIEKTRIWAPAHTITVAFRGGSSDLRNQIAEAVGAWIAAANIHLDFGSGSSGRFREWSTSDTSYNADIRIGFDQEGYWSYVGSDSIKPSIAKVNEASMNFEGFTESLPKDWQAVVLHEFGHALGFEHEHQSPVAPCDNEFRWQDDPGYVKTTDIYGQFIRDNQGRRPGIYTVLEGPPNRWKQDQINFNLKKLPYSTDLLLGEFDKTSIMKYYFPDWMFTHGDQSQCYSMQNLTLSEEDKIFVKKAYPPGTLVSSVLNERIRNMQELVQTPGVPADVKAEFRKNIADYRLAMRGK